MRKAPLIVVVVVFGLFFLVKGLHWLGTDTPAVFATPVAQPDGGGELQPVTVPSRAQACATGITYGPDARYVLITVTTPDNKPAGPLRISASAPGYKATAAVPAGTPNNGQVVARLSAPAQREVGGGNLCVDNLGTRTVQLYGIAGQTTPSLTTVDGQEQPADLSVTLLTSPSQSLGSRLGTLLDHAAAFNPTSAWMLWIVLVLVLLGAPAAVGVALGRAAAEDDAADQREPDSARR